MLEKNYDSIPDGDINDINTLTHNMEAGAAGQSPLNYGGDGIRTYCFEFGDEKNYTVFFEGKLTQDDIHSILKVLHSCLYKDCPETIRLYMEQHHLEYSRFKTEVSLLKHEETMNRAEELLKSGSCDKIDSHLGGADSYYAVMDYQNHINGDCCEGCYYAIQKELDKETCSYHIVGQTFVCGKCDDSPQGYFAIRTNHNGRQIRNLDALSGEPVLPVFGCVDMTGVLTNIGSLLTAGQVRKTAVK